MSCDTVEINGVQYVRQALAQPVPSDVKICVLQRGNVLVGRFSRDGEKCFLDNASVIRTWGTTQGLGQIATGGPTSRTVLDPAGRIEFHILTSIMLIDCDASKWSAHV